MWVISYYDGVSFEKSEIVTIIIYHNIARNLLVKQTKRFSNIKP